MAPKKTKKPYNKKGKRKRKMLVSPPASSRHKRGGIESEKQARWEGKPGQGKSKGKGKGSGRAKDDCSSCLVSVNTLLTLARQTSLSTLRSTVESILGNKHHQNASVDVCVFLKVNQNIVGIYSHLCLPEGKAMMCSYLSFSPFT